MSVNIYDLNVAKLTITEEINLEIDPIAIGIQAGQVNQGSYSIAIGYQAGQFNESE